MKAISKEKVIEALKNVIDPELHVDVHTLGLIYNIETKDEEVVITMTLTTPFCPYGPILLEEVKRNVRAKTKAKKVEVNLTFEPLWTPPDDLRAMLGM